MEKLTHAILIEGGSHEGRMAKAMELLKGHFADDPLAASKLEQGTFEDLVMVEPEDGKEIFVGMVEDLIGLFKQKPFASTGKACIIPCAERMNEPAQNKLLKLLEEPVFGDVLLLLTENAQRLLPTVTSRCMRVRLACEVPAQGPVTEDLRQLTAALVYGKGALAEANAILSRYEGERETAASFLSDFQLFLRGLLIGRHAPELIGGEDAKWLRESAAKVAPRHAERMRKGVLLAEKAKRDIERGDRTRYVLRGMALDLRRQGAGA